MTTVNDNAGDIWIIWTGGCSQISHGHPFVVVNTFRRKGPVDGRAAMDGDGLEPTLLPELAGHPNSLNYFQDFDELM